MSEPDYNLTEPILVAYAANEIDEEEAERRLVSLGYSNKQASEFVSDWLDARCWALELD